MNTHTLHELTPGNRNIAAAMHPATLLVSPSLLSALKTRLRAENMHMSSYIRFLVCKFRFLTADYNFPESSVMLTTRYQETGLALERVNFRVDPAVWHALKLLARAFGISICLAFSILLLLDAEDYDGVLTERRPKFPCDQIYQMEYSEIMQIHRETNQRTIKIRSGPLWPFYRFFDG